MIIAPVQEPLEIRPVRKELDDISADDKIREYEKESSGRIRTDENSKAESSRQAVRERNLGRNIDITA